MKKIKKITTIEDLATLMQQEFLSIHEKIDHLSVDMKSIKSEIKEFRTDLENLKLRFGEVAFRFEIKELEKRLKKLELQIGK